jgi:hypothetical protein
MVNAVPGAGSLKRFGKLNKIPKPVKTIFAIAILGVIAFFIWNHFHNINSSSSVLPTPSHFEQASQKTTSNYLKAKDYTSYQLDRQDLAHEYISNNDYANAERVMNEVLANVPADKITSASYSILFQIEKAKANTTLEKKYLGLMITKLKAEGNNTTAAAAQKVLDGLK